MFYHILLLPLLALVITQICKMIISSNRLKPSFQNLFTYSGMPSGHSALIVALATIVGLEEGWNSSMFAITFILTIIVIRDALGIRRYLGEHGRTLNKLVKDLSDDQVLEKKYPLLLERIGHTPAQVLVGSFVGFIISLTGYLILN